MATGYAVRTITLLSQSASGNGPWMATGRFLSPTITIEGLENGGSVSVRVSNQPEKDDEGKDNPPPIDDLGVPHNILGAVTSNTGAGLGGAFTWIRAIKTAGTNPTVTKVISQSQIAK